MPTRFFDTFLEPKIYTNGQAFFPVLEKVIQEAQKEILIGQYIFSFDMVGKKIMRCLALAARRGVRIRVLFDDVEMLKDSSMQIKNFLQDAGIEIIRFRPLDTWLPRHPLAAGCRHHLRFVLVDHTVFGLGGMPFAEVALQRQDLFMLCVVDDAKPLKNYFEKIWKLASRVSITETLAIKEDMGLPHEYRLLVSGPQKRDQKLYRWLTDTMKTAQERIVIATPFFFPDRALLREIINARHRGVHVEITTPLRTDKPRYDLFRAVPIPFLRQHGVRWYGARKYFHAKFCIVDNRWTFGSANIDMLCTQRNYDLNVCGQGGAALHKLEACAAELKKHAKYIASQPMPFWFRILITLFRGLTEFFFKLT